MTFVSALFWFMVFLLVFTYVGYPVFIYIVAAFVERPLRKKDNYFPSLTLLIPAYNEAGVLQRKLENSLGLDYPSGLLEIIVISDASTDATDAIADSFAEKGVRLIINAQRSGKTQGLNRAVKIARGEILVFTDANAFFEKEALRLLVKGFADDSVGLITGSTRYYSQAAEGGVALSLGFYARLEHWLKTYESIIGSCVGADGAIFALRKSLYTSLKSTDINDLVIPLNTVRRGYRVVFDPDVICREDHTTSVNDEFKRQIRISNRTVNALLGNADLLNPFQVGNFAWALFFHKWLRFLFPFIVILSTILNLVLVFVFSGWAYLIPLVGGGLLLISPFVVQTAKGAFFSIIQSFVITNIAIFIGWKKALRNEVIVTWGDRENVG